MNDNIPEPKPLLNEVNQAVELYDPIWGFSTPLEIIPMPGLKIEYESHPLNDKSVANNDFLVSKLKELEDSINRIAGTMLRASENEMIIKERLESIEIAITKLNNEIFCLTAGF